MSPRLDKNDLQFLRFLTSNEPTFNQRLNNHRETVDAILDLKSMKKSFSQVSTRKLYLQNLTLILFSLQLRCSNNIKLETII